MRITAVLLALLLLLAGPSLAGKKKKQLLEECTESIEFVDPLADEGALECDYWLQGLRGVPKEVIEWRDRWLERSSGTVDDNQYEVVDVVSPNVLSLEKDEQLQAETRKEACKIGGNAILEWRIACRQGSQDYGGASTNYTDFPSKTFFGVVIKWVKPTDE